MSRRRRDLAAAGMLAAGTLAVLAVAYLWATLAGVAATGIVLVVIGVALGME